MAKKKTEDEVNLEGLTDRERVFVLFYCGKAGFKASTAAKLAGCVGSTTAALSIIGNRFMRKPRVQAAIARLIARMELDPENTKNGIATIAQSSLANFLRREDDGNWVADLDQASAVGALGQIKEITWMKIKVPGGGQKAVPEKIKIHDPLPARALLARIQGLLVDRLANADGSNLTINVVRTPRAKPDDQLE